MTNRKPPQAAESEQALIASVLIYPSTITDADLTRVPPEAMTDPYRAAVWRHVLSLYQNDQAVDLVTLSDSLRVKGDAAAIPTLIACMDTAGTGAYASDYADSIMEAFKLRQVITLCGQVSNEAYKGVSSREVMERLEGGLAGMQVGLRTSHLDAQADELMEGSAGLPTGFTTLDKATGGLPLGGLTVLGARSSMGKSALAHAIAKNIAQQGRYGELLSPDMSLFDIASMEASRLSRIPLPLLSNREAGQKDKQAWRAAFNEAKAYWTETVRVDDGRLTLEMLPLKVKQAARRGASYVFVDHLQRITGKSSKVDVVIDVVDTLADLAREYNLAVMLLSQLSREIDKRPDKRPIMTDLSWGKQIEESARMVWFLHRDSYYADTPNAKNKVAEVLIAKNKAGARNITRTVAWNDQFATFTNF